MKTTKKVNKISDSVMTCENRSSPVTTGFVSAELKRMWEMDESAVFGVCKQASVVMIQLKPKNSLIGSSNIR